MCVPNKTENLNLSISNLIIGINKSKILTKHVLGKCKCKFNSRKCNSNQNWKNSECQWEYKNPKKYRVWKKDYIWNPAKCTCENSKYVGRITDDSVITCDEIIEEAKRVPPYFNEKR